MLRVVVHALRQQAEAEPAKPQTVAKAAPASKATVPAKAAKKPVQKVSR
jgi:hypothetical protein